MLTRPLAEIVGPEFVISDPGRLLAYESDGLTAYRSTPRAVVLPSTAREVSEVVAFLHAEGVPVVPRGAGTGLSGGALAGGDAVVLGTARMNRIIDFDPSNRRARVQPGVVNARLTELAAPHGLQYAPDPSSQSACTIGGNVAENSGGPHCLKHGVTSRYVLGLEVVLVGGRLCRLGGPEGDPLASLDLVGLFVGSEGCFGVVTEIELGLVPAPEEIRTLLGVFESVEDAGMAVTRIMASGLLPAALEIVDAETIRAVEASVYAAGYPADAGAALVIEFDGSRSGLGADALAAAECCRESGAREVRTAESDRERAALWKGRKKAFGAMGRIAPDLLVQDATVPRTALPAVLDKIGRIGDRHDLRIANVFHAGDGNLHPNILFDRTDEAELAKVERASKEIMTVCVEAGGTITGEHGVGADKREYMRMVHGPAELAALREVKAVFDPAGLFNPGKVVPDREAGEVVPDARAGDGTAEEPSTVGPRSTTSIGSPATEAELAAALADARERGLKVTVVGSGEHEIGRPPDWSVTRISLARFDRIHRYEPADLTMTVGAGMRLGRLASIMAERGQWLPWNPPDFGNRSVGGLLATAEGGALAGHYGGVRDHVLGMRVMCGDSRVLELGGRVVKNVAGFDLLRPLVGGLGCAAVTSATLRTFPLPEAMSELVFEADGIEEAAELALAFAAETEPAVSSTVDWSGPGPTRVRVRLHGRKAMVEVRGKALSRRARPGSRFVEASLHGRATADSGFRNGVAGERTSGTVDAGETARDLRLTWFALPAALGRTLALAKKSLRGLELEARAAVAACAKAGWVSAVVADPFEDDDLWVEEVRFLRASCKGERSGGRSPTLRVEGAPGVSTFDGEESGPPWTAETKRIRAGVRRIFDPGGLFWDPREAVSEAPRKDR